MPEECLPHAPVLQCVLWRRQPPHPSHPPRNDLRDAFRIYLSASSLAYLKLSPGSPCSLHLEGGIEKTAVAWNAVGDIKTTVVQASSILQLQQSLIQNSTISTYLLGLRRGVASFHKRGGGRRSSWYEAKRWICLQ